MLRLASRIPQAIRCYRSFRSRAPLLSFYTSVVAVVLVVMSVIAGAAAVPLAPNVLLAAAGVVTRHG